MDFILKTRFYQYFLQLTVKEKGEFLLFLESELHNKQKKLPALLNIYNAVSSNTLTISSKSELFNRLFEGEQFDWQKVHYLNSYLLKALENYVAWKKWRNDSWSQNLYGARAFEGKPNTQFIQKKIAKSQKQLDNQTIRDAQYFRRSFEGAWVQNQNFIENGQLSKLNLQNLSNNLDISFVAEKLKTACLLLSHQAIAKTEYDTGLLDTLLIQLPQSDLLNYPAIAIYYYAYLSLLSPDKDEDFIKLKILVEEQIQNFSLKEAMDIYRLAINNCIRRINLGKKEYIAQVFDLYKSGLQKGVYLNNGQMPLRTYSNIIGSGLRLKEYEWVYRFIYEYKDVLPKKSREPFFSYNLAKYHFELKNYDEAMQLLLKMEYDDLLHNLTARTMLSQMYYELGELKVLDSHLSSFKVYLIRKKVLGYHKENYQRFIVYLNKIIQVNRFDKEEVLNLKNEIAETKIVAEKDWLWSQL